MKADAPPGAAAGQPTSPSSTRMAHVIVTEGLEDKEFIAERCDDRAVQHLARVHQRLSWNAPEMTSRTHHRHPGRRSCAPRRAFTPAPNGSHLLRPRCVRAQPGLDHGDGHRQPGDGHRQPRSRGRRCQPAARPEQRPGLLRHGLVPARAAGLPARLRWTRSAHAASRSDWGVTASAEPGLRIPNMFDSRRSAGTFKALYVQGEDVAQSDPNTQHVEAR